MKIDKHIIANENLRNVYMCILNHEPINKALIAKQITLSLPSVSMFVDKLEENGLVKSLGTVSDGVGKPKQMYAINTGSCHAIGVDIGKGKTRILLVDTKGRVDDQILMPTNLTSSVEAFAAEICGAIRLIKIRNHIDRLLGVGFGIPGIVDNDTGYIHFSPDFRWENLDFKSLIRQWLDDELFIENSNVAMTQGEYFFGAGKDARCLLGVNLGHGIGGGIIDAGGRHDDIKCTSCEIGHITVDKDGPTCLCGNTGCLEAVASGDAIALQAQNLVERNVETMLARSRCSEIDAKMVFDAAKAGDGPAGQIITRAIGYIAIGLATVANISGCDTIVLSGGLVKNGEKFVSMVQQSMLRRLMRFNRHDIDFRLGALGDNAVAIGAAHEIIRRNLFHDIEYK